MYSGVYLNTYMCIMVCIYTHILHMYHAWTLWEMNEHLTPFPAFLLFFVQCSLKVFGLFFCGGVLYYTTVPILLAKMGGGLRFFGEIHYRRLGKING